ncbi:CaiB/BaiF CoA transferase family protein [Alloalcanivorax sp.]|jgi:crotonobetainyl-CoA:carnitine CoA-transferase CaiB-like acyl-CoA transferase|uniref:CaiB/BaiF CoA transferase family protein n=1 Tax=Alloalcanivorax TaxID=3020832 RepID=UPI002EC6AFAD|nr:CaiB/BaiF CoA-transferase family protein [Pseudomonadota bacterium]
MNQRALPLAGVKVVELGQLLAGPFAGTLLAYFGAEVIKVEPPGGDPIRGWRTLDDTGTSFWWRSLGRNKRSVTLDLKSDAGRELAARLIDDSDVLIENFRPGTLENWGLGPERFKESNPGLIYTRISGYGQDGPYADKPGYASVCEGIGGLRYVNGFPGERPVRPNLSLGDTVAGLHAALGIALALLERHSSQQGQVVDVALFESVFNLLEAVIPEFDGAGEIRQPAGSTVTGIVPTNTYRCADGKYVIIGGNGDSIFKRLMVTAERPDLAEDPRLAKNPGRVENEAEIDGAIEAWCATLPSPDVLAKLEANRVPCGPIYSAADMMADPHFQARGLFQQVEINGAPLKIPAILPRLGGTPGGTRWPGGDAGCDTESVARGELGLSEEEFQRLKAEGVFGA